MGEPKTEIDLSLYFMIKNRCRHHYNQLGEHDGWLEFTGELMAYLYSIQAELEEEIKANNLSKN